MVLLNAAMQRSDGIVVTADGPPVRVPLPELRLADVERWVAELADATTASGTFAAELRRQRVLGELLGWLWDTAVGPVLAALPAELDRVWWLPTGPLGLLPVHAAGHSGEPGALERVVSSYTPTLRTLARARTRRAAGARRQLTVALDRTRGGPTSRCSPTSEPPSAGCRPRWPTPAGPTSPVTPRPTRTPRRSVACTCTTVCCRSPRSAAATCRRHSWRTCRPARPGHAGRRHVDEVIHLASAFQLAGFQHVIASLWPLDDGVAAAAADRFYRLLPDTPSADRAAFALHEVVRELRAEHPNQPHLWASLVHSGP